MVKASVQQWILPSQFAKVNGIVLVPIRKFVYCDPLKVRAELKELQHIKEATSRHTKTMDITGGTEHRVAGASTD